MQKKKIKEQKKTCRTLYFAIITVLLFGSNSNVFSQKADAFEFVVLPYINEDLLAGGEPTKVKLQTLYEWNGYTYSVSSSNLPSILERNNATGEIKLYGRNVFPEMVDLAIDNIFRQPYSNKLWFHYQFSIGGFSTFERQDENIEFKKVFDLRDPDWKFGAPWVIRPIHNVATFPPSEWEHLYNKSDAFLWYMQSDRIGNSNPHIYETAIMKLCFSNPDPENPIYRVVDTFNEVVSGGTFHYDGWRYNGDEYRDKKHTVVMPDSTIWMFANGLDVVRFCEKTMEFTRWRISTPMQNLGEYKSISKLHLFRDNETPKNSKLCVYVASGELIFWENGDWRTEKINFDGSEMYISNIGNPNFHLSWEILDWNVDEVAFGFWNSSSQDTAIVSKFARTLVIYNYKTKQARDFVIPAEVFPEGVLTELKEQFKGRDFFHTISDIINLKDGKKGILFSLHTYSVYNNAYIIYDPSKDDWISVNETEARGLPNLWVRNIYPNPATATSKITANIMCYLSTVSDVEIGLYDFMGQKVLDLSNHFEYEPATATIHISFVLPKNLSKGSYFLVVRSGTETRTRGIIVK